MNWLKKIFKKENQSRTAQSINSYEGLIALEQAERLLYDRSNRNENLLSYYDRAIECGIFQAYEGRGFALQSFNYHLDAINDFNEAIKIESRNPNLYFGRALSKYSVYELESAIEDLKMAISLSEHENDENIQRNKQAKSMGWNTATDLYRFTLNDYALQLKFNKENPEMANRLKRRSESKLRKRDKTG